ncbi:hypothetical protein EP18_14670 [Lysinibacillus sphaericus]|nr:hypothetical protein EP18_14670 [Lysinibacillus sphaericus]
MYYGEQLISYKALQKKINEYINYYNNVRIKQKLAGMSPVNYEGTEKLQLVPLSEVFDDSIIEYLAFLIYN